MENMREQDHGNCVPEVTHRFIGYAKGTVSHDRGAIVKVETAGINGGDPGFQQIISFGQLALWPKVAEAGEEHIVGCLKAG